MKKALLIGAVVSSMALSSVSFAAVNYGQEWTEDTHFVYDKADGILTLTGEVEKASNATTDTTIVVVAGTHPDTIDQSNIMYIDQAAEPATYGDMGLLLPETIADGAKATVYFNDGSAAIYAATFDLKETVTPPVVNTVKFVFGDVNGTYTEGTTPISLVDAADALAILSLSTGGSVAKGGAFDIGTVVTAVVD